ncbi:MAG: hypothetical protein ABI400_09810, partial [Lacisediminihabitans sp.]
MPSSESALPLRAAETLPPLSGRSLRALRHVRALRVLRRNTAIVSSLFGLLLGAGYGIPAYAQATETPAPPVVQTLTVSAQVDHAAAGRDGYTVIDPPALQWPVSASSPISDGFGPRISPCAGCSSYHEGVDFDAGYGTAVHAIAAGVVTETNNPGYSALGVHVTIQHL